MSDQPDEPGCTNAGAEVVLVHVDGDASPAYTAPYESLRLGSIATRLSRSGIPVRLVDTALMPGGRDAALAVATRGSVVVIDALFRTVGAALVFAMDVRRRGGSGKIVLVGDAVRASATALLADQRHIDAVVVGEAEAAVLAFATDPDGHDGVPGIAMRSHPRPRRVPADRLHTGPSAARRPYARPALAARPVVDILTSEGCASRCSFCMVGRGFVGEDGAAAARWRPRLVDDVAEEIRSIVDTLGARRFHFADDNFIGSPRLGACRAADLATSLEPLGISFSFYCRADAVEPELFSHLRRAGLCQVHLGVESGNDRTLRRLRKDQTTATVDRALRVLRDLEIRVVPSFIVFEVRQSLPELVESLRWIQASGTHEGFSPSGCIPLPGTVMLRELRQAGLVETMPGWQQAFAGVTFADERVGTVAGAVRTFERELDSRCPGYVEELATAYHRFNDRLDIASTDPPDPLVEEHARFRAREVRLALASAVEGLVGTALAR